MSFLQVRIALITLAKPLKKVFPSSKLSIESNSSNDAPEQNVLPSLCNIITETESFSLKISNVFVSSCNKWLGKELLAALKNVIVAILSSILYCTNPFDVS